MRRARKLGLIRIDRILVLYWYAGPKAVDKCKATGYSISSENPELPPQGLEKALFGGQLEGASDAVDKLRAMLTFLQDMEDPERLRAFPLWRAHQRAGERKGSWSLHVTRNWRLTFQIRDGEIVDVDYEDYH